MFKRILALIKKEFLSIWRDPKSRMLILIPPIMQLFIFAYAITMEIKNIDMVVLDRNNSVESRELITRFSDSKWFRKIIYVHNENEVKEAIDNQDVLMALEINSDFSKNIYAKKPTDVQVIVDGRQTNSAAIASNYATQIIGSYENDIGLKTPKPSIQADIRSWYNPNLQYIWHTLISLTVILGMVITLLLTALSVARERELGTFDQLLVSPATTFEILAGKTIPPLCIAMCLTTFMTCMAVFFFKVPFVGSIPLFFLSMFVALFSIVGVGLFVSSLCKTQQQAILGAFTFQMPATLLSGFVSPIEDMPKIFQIITYADPIRFYLAIQKGIFLKDMSVFDVFTNLVPLMILAFVTLSLAGWMFKRKLD